MKRWQMEWLLVSVALVWGANYTQESMEWHICHPFNLIVYDFSSITGIITYHFYDGTLITY